MKEGAPSIGTQATSAQVKSWAKVGGAGQRAGPDLKPGRLQHWLVENVGRTGQLEGWLARRLLLHLKRASPRPSRPTPQRGGARRPRAGCCESRTGRMAGAPRTWVSGGRPRGRPPFHPRPHPSVPSALHDSPRQTPRGVPSPAARDAASLPARSAPKDDTRSLPCWRERQPLPRGRKPGAGWPRAAGALAAQGSRR